MLNKTLPVPTVGHNLVHNSAIGDEQQVSKPLTKFSCFAMAHKNRVADLEWFTARVLNRRLHLSGAFKRDKFSTPGQVRLWLLFRADRTRSDKTTTEARVNM